MLWLKLRGGWVGRSRSDEDPFAACGGGCCERLHLPFPVAEGAALAAAAESVRYAGRVRRRRGTSLNLTYLTACRPLALFGATESVSHAQGVRGRLRETSLTVCYASAALVASALAAGLLLCETPRIGIKAWATRKKNPDAARPAGTPPNLTDSQPPPARLRDQHYWIWSALPADMDARTPEKRQAGSAGVRTSLTAVRRRG